MAVGTTPQNILWRGNAPQKIKRVADETATYAKGTLVFAQSDDGAAARSYTAGDGDQVIGFCAATVEATAGTTEIEIFRIDSPGTEWRLPFDATGAQNERELVFFPAAENDPGLAEVDGAGQTNYLCLGKIVQYVDANGCWINGSDRSADALGTA